MQTSAENGEKRKKAADHSKDELRKLFYFSFGNVSRFDYQLNYFDGELFELLFDELFEA